MPSGSAIDQLLTRLDGVRTVGPGRWRARCPAHEGRNRQALSIAEGSDGAVLVKCFHGCCAVDIVRACGLELADLFPRNRDAHSTRPRRVRPDWPALIGACERDLLLTKIVLCQVGQGEMIEPTDAAACQAAADRVLALIHEARDG